MIDDAILRPGRFGRKHYVPLPGADERVSILKAHARSRPISLGVDLNALACREECNTLTEGPKLATRGGVNGSRSKFLSKLIRRPISQKSPQTLKS